MQLLEFEAVVTDAERSESGARDGVRLPAAAAAAHAQVAVCEPGHVGAWNGEWEECTILNTHDHTFDCKTQPQCCIKTCRRA